MKTSFERMQVKAPCGKRSALGSDDSKEDYYRSDPQLIEKESYRGSSDGSRTRRKSARDDHSWKKDYQEKRSNGWDSDWSPSSSAYTEEKYVPAMIKLKESPKFMQRYEEEEGFYDVRDMQPVVRLRKAWREYQGEDEMQVDYEANPPPPPPKGGKPVKWIKTDDGEWIEEKRASSLSASVKPPPPPPPPPPLPPSNLREKELMNTTSTVDRRDYAKLVSLEHLNEDDEIPEWAKKFNAPPAPIVRQPETSFVESKPLIEHEEFDGHAAIKKGHPCFLCNEVMFFSGLAWTYCKAGPPVPRGNRARYELN
eukprot:555838-Amphidinium_carterae.1